MSRHTNLQKSRAAPQIRATISLIPLLLQPDVNHQTRNFTAREIYQRVSVEYFKTFGTGIHADLAKHCFGSS